eukprot:7138342-Alexandrium_andersonii.AAC.1
MQQEAVGGLAARALRACCVRPGCGPTMRLLQGACCVRPGCVLRASRVRSIQRACCARPGP